MPHTADILLGYQRAWIDDKHPVKWWEKSRRIGASWAEALDAVLAASLAREHGGQSTYYLAYNKDMTEQFIKDCAWWARALNVVAGQIEGGLCLLGDPDRDVLVYRIRFASGHEVVTLPSEARSLRSKQGRVVIDEAAFVDNLEEVLKAAMALLMWGGQVRVISTHNGEENLFNERIQEIRAGKWDYALHRTTLDDALGHGLYRAICRQLGTPWSPQAETAWRADIVHRHGDNADEELFCIPKRSGGAWLPGALIEGCMAEQAADVPVLRWRPPVDSFVDVPLPQAEAMVAAWLEEHVAPLLAMLPRDRNHYVGGDFGRSGDLSVFWPLTERVDLTMATPFLLELRDAPFRTQEQILTYLVNGLPRWGGVSLDARGNGQALAEYARQTWGPSMVAEVMLSEGWYREHMPRVKAHMEDRTIVLPRDADVKDDLRSLRMVRGVPRVPETRNRGSNGQRHADSAVALALALHAQATLGAVEPWEVETVGRHHAVILKMSS
jgi:phage FluMu gp28-like protein